MDEREFLRTYDPNAFEQVSVAVDLVLMSVADGAPVVLLQQRVEHPFRGCWALPGGFVGPRESLDEAARRVSSAKARIEDAYVEQLYTFGEPGRDPRTRVISVGYFALLPVERFRDALRSAPDLSLASLAVEGQDTRIVARLETGEPLSLAFDHAHVLATAMRRLRGKLDWSPVAFALLPETFTLRALQDVHEAILGVPLNKTAFRRRLLDSGRIEPTGTRETGTSFRPAELFRRKPD